MYICIIIIFLLFAEFCCLLEGQSPSIPPNEDDVMISGEGSAQPSPSPPGSCLITAQVEGTTLTRARYTRIASLMSSLLCLLTRALVYVGQPSSHSLYTGTVQQQREERAILDTQSVFSVQWLKKALFKLMMEKWIQ